MKLPKAAPAAVERFEELLPRGPGITRRLVFGCPSAFLHGNMFFGVFGESLFVRLSDPDRIEAIQTEGAVPFEPIKGHVMSGYVVLPESVLEAAERAERWVGRSLEWTGKLPPKEPGGGKKPARKSPPPPRKTPSSRRDRG